MEMTLVDVEGMAADYNRVEQAIQFLEKNAYRQPELREVAESVHLSEYHFQRLFTRWVGISPKRFLQYLTKENAKALLAQSASLLDASYETGLSGPGRLHDLFVTYEAATPGEYKSGGEGLTVEYGFHPSPFGETLLAATERGVCHLAFVRDGGRPAALAELERAWPGAALIEAPEVTRPLIAQAFQLTRGEGETPLRLHLKGTSFQLKVWEALLRIPAGTLISYEDLAVLIAMPQSARAVGNAVGSNPIPVIIPCHRVIRKSGEIGNYGGGRARKKALIAWEQRWAHASP